MVIVNQGSTRGDGYARLRVDAPLGRLLPALADRLCPDIAVTVAS
ncbi:hypothetical protein [Micromonospora craniellae]|nr:hypothetical protein [Micromonospora craniellae]